MFIDKSLRDIKSRKIDRRQLIKGMTLPAIGAFVESAGLGAAPAFARIVKAKKGFQATSWNHISRSGYDDAKSRDFYVDLFGMECTWYTPEDGSEIDFGELDAINDGDRDSIFIRKVASNSKPSVDHLAFSVEHFDIDEAEAIIKSFGYTYKYDGKIMWTVLDPDGYVAQPGSKIGNFPGGIKPGTSQYPGFKDLYTMPHPLQPLLPFPEHSLKSIGAVVSLKVTDVAKSRNFYRDLLGLKVSVEKPDACFLRFGRHDGLLLSKNEKGDNKTYADHFTIIVTNKPEVVEAELKRRNLNPQKDSQVPVYAFIDLDGITVKVAGTDILEGKMGFVA
jgi:catechol 2,3-dioxygenase-like lactoylglutathione lyase family enzyme